jgi:hypothetical protein
VAAKANSGGNPPRRVTPSGAPKARVTKVTTVKAVKRRTFSSVASWDRKSAGKWQTKQSNTLNPGSTQATARRRNTTKYVARTKKVIRPRVRKQQQPDN